MARLYKVAELAEKALEKIGAFTPQMVSANPDELSRTIVWMDLLVSETSGTNRCFWLTPATTTTALTAATPSYTLSTFLGTDYPSDGIIFPDKAYVRDSNGSDTEIEIIARDKYEEIPDKSASGIPDRIYIDRQSSNQQLYVWPVPADGTSSLRLVFQKYSKDLTGGSPDGGGNISHGLAAEWQRWLILATAADIGSGPVRALPIGERQLIRGEAGAAFSALQAFANREKESVPPVTDSSLLDGGFDSNYFPPDYGY